MTGNFVFDFLIGLAIAAVSGSLTYLFGRAVYRHYYPNN